jgi:hypothetical protein
MRGRCARCKRADTRLVRAYWGDDLCPGCCDFVARALNERGKWPPLPPEYAIPDTPAGIDDLGRAT